MVSIFFFLIFSKSADKYENIVTTAQEAKEILDRTSYKINDRILVWARIYNSTDPSQGNQTIRFYPEVDKLTMLRIPLYDNDNKLFEIDNTSMIEFHSGTSCVSPKPYQLMEIVNDKKYVVDFLSVLLFFDQGKNQAIAWDNTLDTNSCKNRNSIINRTCTVSYTDSYKFIKVYVASVGTDSKKVSLSSAQNLPSTFLKFGVGGVVDDATDFVNKAVDWFKKPTI